MEQLDRDMLKELHAALDAITALFASEHGFDYTAVSAALTALSHHPDLPVTVALAEKIEKMKEARDA